MSLQWKMQTSFPFTRVFVLGVMLFFLGLASMIIAIIAFVTHSWGHYVGTGMWGGATILASGLTAIFVSRLKSLASVKTFCICAVTAMFTSLTVLILSAGGLTLSSGFYSRIDLADYNQRTSNLIHASLLVISVFSLSGNVLAVIVCCKYLFFEPHVKPKHSRRHRNLTEGTIRTTSTLRGGAPNTSSLRSTNSRIPLHSNDHPSRRHSDNVDVNRVQIEYRRAHRRTASDQPQAVSHTRRQRHSHQESGQGFSNNNSNLLSSCGIRYYPDKRHSGGRSCSQARETRGDSKERERLNIIPCRQGGNSGRTYPLANMQMRHSRSPVSGSPKIRLPTEFDEEELPPYEAVEASASAMPGSASDSGDESDTENSSSTDAHSYNAADFGDENAETVPMVEIRCDHRRDNYSTGENEHRTTNFTTSAHDNHVHKSQNRKQSDNRHSEAGPSSSARQESHRQTSACEGPGVMVIRRESGRSNRPLLGYINTHSMDQTGDYERLLSVSPEVCAITGESPEPTTHSQGRMPHAVQENIYENGPCYENVRCVGINLDDSVMNHLSKSSSSNLAEASTSSQLRDKKTDSNSKTAASARKVPVHVISRSPPVCSTSPQSPQGSFGSPHSAFRPVGATSSALSPHNICSPSAQSPQSLHSNDERSPHNSITDVHQADHNVYPHIYSNEHRPHGASALSPHSAQKYKEQGAIPKTVMNSQNHSGPNLSWKNIPLPLSYNHSESASNEPEKKLPPKTIPFTDLNIEASKEPEGEALAQNDPSSRLSLRVYPSQNHLSSTVSVISSANKASELPVSPFVAAAEAILSPSTKCNPQPANVQSVPVTAMSSGVMTSSVREASTQVNSGAVSRWHSHRMGGNQALLQSRREELLNSQLSRRAFEASGRPVRPSSLPASGGQGVNLESSGHRTEGQQRNRASEAASSGASAADSSQSLLLNSYRVNQQAQGQQAQPSLLRQAHHLPHYMLQPQQPRLGVQLHQRRQQQHQLQQNLESQQQHQQLQQQQQQQPGPQLQQQGQQGGQQNAHPQQARNGRPLFSVLL